MTNKVRQCDCNCGKTVPEDGPTVESRGDTYKFVDKEHKAEWERQNNRLNHAATGRDTADKLDARMMRLYGGE
jgi:hypothetical protein